MFLGKGKQILGKRKIFRGKGKNIMGKARYSWEKEKKTRKRKIYLGKGKVFLGKRKYSWEKENCFSCENENIPGKSKIHIKAPKNKTHRSFWAFLQNPYTTLGKSTKNNKKQKHLKNM